MAQRLQDILGNLYRPSGDGLRQVFPLSWSDAERLPILASIAVIPITAPARPAATLDSVIHVLHLGFADLDFLNLDLSDWARARLADAVTIERASAIRIFVEGLRDEKTSVVAHSKRATRAHVPSPRLHLYGYRAEPGHLLNANPTIVSVTTGEVLGADTDEVAALTASREAPGCLAMVAFRNLWWRFGIRMMAFLRVYGGVSEYAWWRFCGFMVAFRHVHMRIRWFPPNKAGIFMPFGAPNPYRNAPAVFRNATIDSETPPCVFRNATIGRSSSSLPSGTINWQTVDKSRSAAFRFTCVRGACSGREEAYRCCPVAGGPAFKT
ncbi:hypothetical protein [Paraburkholderia sp. J7]|uniref:hypothetical protein n=1 Tax=Paraburkholderia sp. J7 TaxID=2805438 RepID=UPI002AB675D4|nr:hypothetical protein [Paraburkholderia sp. J7]